MSNQKILVVAFDGLDYELIKEFGLENIQQEEFGKIDNQTRISSVKTSELFAAFITGANYEKNGVKGHTKWTNSKVDKLEEILDAWTVFEKFKGIRTALYRSINRLNCINRKYRKEDLETETIFEEIENSRAMYVPSYNPSIFWIVGAGLDPFKYGYSSAQVEENWDQREFENRKTKLFDELDSDILPARDLLMCHFHRPDLHQHLYGDKFIGSQERGFNKSKLRELYLETDELAGEIKQKALKKGYDRIIFMSDHGLPTESEHNENAFYSCNKPLFDEKPKITDFYRKLKMIND